MKPKYEIENYSDKASFLRENGWETYYNDDNWIMVEWIRQGKKYDWMGISTDDAYKMTLKKRDEILREKSEIEWEKWTK